MKSFLFFASLALLSVAFTSCKQDRQGMMPEINDADSVAVLYYDNPGNYRFFRYTKVQGINQVKSIVQDVNGKVIPSKNQCTTQGKINFYKGKEEVYTVYFCRAEGCMTFSFIKNGKKYFTSMSEASKKILDKLQASAKEPTPVN